MAVCHAPFATMEYPPSSPISTLTNLSDTSGFSDMELDPQGPDVSLDLSIGVSTNSSIDENESHQAETVHKLASPGKATPSPSSKVTKSIISGRVTKTKAKRRSRAAQVIIADMKAKNRFLTKTDKSLEDKN